MCARGERCSEEITLCARGKSCALVPESVSSTSIAYSSQLYLLICICTFYQAIWPHRLYGDQMVDSGGAVYIMIV
jgi:hypothetical protein